MHRLISEMLDRYERGALSRRELVGGLAAAAAFPQTAPGAGPSTFRGTELNHLALNVTDVKRSRDFYQKHLGSPVLTESGSSCFLGLGTNFLALFQNPNPRMNHFCVGIENYEVRKVTAELERQGLDPRQPSGTNRVYFKDPDGLEVQLAAADHQP